MMAAGHGFLCPQHCHGIFLKFSIMRDDRQALALGLGDQHAVEGVGVMVRQVLHGLSMGIAEWKLEKSSEFDFIRKPARRIQFSEFRFDRNFHRCHGADKDGSIRVSQDFLGLFVDAVGSGKHPQENMGIEQIIH